MTTRALFQNLAKTVFDIFDDIADSRTYRSYTASTYSLATGKATQGYTDYQIRSILTEINEDRDNFSDILSKDRKVIFPFKEASFTPRNGDVIIDGSTTFQVIEIKLDPADAAYILQVRETHA